MRRSQSSWLSLQPVPRPSNVHEDRSRCVTMRKCPLRQGRSHALGQGQHSASTIQVYWLQATVTITKSFGWSNRKISAGTSFQPHRSGAILPRVDTSAKNSYIEPSHLSQMLRATHLEWVKRSQHNRASVPPKPALRC